MLINQKDVLENKNISVNNVLPMINNQIHGTLFYLLTSSKLKKRTVVLACLFILLLFSTLFRIIHCFNYTFVDEYVSFNFIMQRLLGWSFPADRYSFYPILYPFVVALPTALWAKLLSCVGVIPTATAFSGLAKVEPELCLLAGRIVNVIIALVTLIMIYLIANRITDEISALFAVTCIGLSNIHIGRSATFQPDVLGVLFVVLAIDMSLRAIDRDKTNYFIWSGVFAGLGAATKFYPGLILMSIFVAHLILLYKEHSITQFTKWFDKRIVKGFFFAVLFFLIGSPVWMFDLSNWLQSIKAAIIFFPDGKIGSFGPPYIEHIIRIWKADGVIIFFFGSSFLYCLLSNKSHRVLITYTAFLIFLYIGQMTFKQPHHLLILYPLLALSASILIHDISLKISPNIRPIIIFTIFFLIFFLPISECFKNSINSVLKIDNRIKAQKWIQNNISSNSKIAVDWEYIPRIFSTDFKKSLLNGNDRIFFQHFFSTHRGFDRTYEIYEFKANKDDLKCLKADFIVTSSGCYDRFFNSTPPPIGNKLRDIFYQKKEVYDNLLHTPKLLGWRVLKTFSDGTGPAIVILSKG